MIARLEPQTYLPSSHSGVAKLDELLRAGDNPEFALVHEDTTISLPSEISAILTQIVAAMRAGKAVTVTPQSQTLTTQQAADLLGISRPTVIKKIDSGEIPCTRTSNRRTLLLDDVLEFQRVRRERLYDAIAALETDYEADTDETTKRRILAEARAARIARTRSR